MDLTHWQISCDPAELEPVSLSNRGYRSANRARDRVSIPYEFNNSSCLLSLFVLVLATCGNTLQVFLT